MDNNQLKIEQAKLELNIRLEEYKSLRAEIVSTLTAGYTAVNLTLTAIGILIAGSPFLFKTGKPILFAVASLLFYVLNWIQLRYVLAVYNMSKHLIDSVNPQIRDTLKFVYPNFSRPISSDDKVESHKILESTLTWELGGKEKNHSDDKWFMPLEASRYAISLLAGVCSFSTYLVLTIQQKNINWLGDGAVTIISVLLFYYSVKVNIRVRNKLME